jgi:hypothetical protein
VKATVVVRESAPAAPDWWYRTYVICTGLLVVVGAVGVHYAIKTLKAIQRQALSMRRQTTLLRQSANAAKISSDAGLIGANASMKQAQHIVNSERPLLMI